MTKSIYVDWENQVIVATATDKEYWINDWIDEHACLYSFGDWLEEYHGAVEIYDMTSEEKAELPLRYEQYLHHSRDVYGRKAEMAFKDRFEEIGIEVGGYAE